MIKVWDLNTGKLLNTIKDHDHDGGGHNSVAITSDDTKIALGSNYGMTKVWDLDTCGLLNTLEGHALSIFSDNSKLVSISDDKTIKVWDLHQGKYCWGWKFETSISSVVVSRCGNLIVLVDSYGNLYAGTLYT